MAPKVQRKTKKKSVCPTASTTDTEELSFKEQIRDLQIERDKLNENIRGHDTIIDQLSKENRTLQDCIGSLQANGQSLSEEVHGTKAKLFDALNNNTQLRNDLKLAQKCIQRETGETLTFAQLTSNQSTWRGRAQQICVLQSKIAELKTQSDALMPETDPKVQQLRRVNAQRKQEVEDLQKQLTNSKLDGDEVRTKLSAQRVRNKNLQDEVAAMKVRVGDCGEKSSRDDHCIAGLNDKIAVLYAQLNAKMCEMHQQNTAHERHGQELQNRHTDLQNTINGLLGDIANKTAVIAQLQQQNTDIESEMKNVCGDFLFSCRDLRKDEYMAILDVLQGEKESLLEQVDVMNGRLERERERIAELQESLRRQNIKYSRLDFKYNECIKEQMNIKERNRRSLRIAQYAKCTNPATTSSNVSLDHHRSTTSFASKSSSSEHFQYNLQISELKNKQDLSTERIRMLEEQIVELTQEKSKDAELYRNIIAKSKYLLVDNMLERKRIELTEPNTSRSSARAATTRQ